MAQGQTWFGAALRLAAFRNSGEAPDAGCGSCTAQSGSRCSRGRRGIYVGFAPAIADHGCRSTAGRSDRWRAVSPRAPRFAPSRASHGSLSSRLGADGFVQVNATTTFPGRIRAWGIHRLTVDRLFAATGSLCIVCYDGRRGSLTFGCVNEFMLGERNQGLIVIPPGIISRVEECRGGRGDDRQHAEPTLRPRRSRSLGAAVGLRGRPKNHPVPMAIAPGSVLRGSTLSSGDGASLFERIAPRL
jgi:hypothetical protein